LAEKIRHQNQKLTLACPTASAVITGTQLHIAGTQKIIQVRGAYDFADCRQHIYIRQTFVAFPFTHRLFTDKQQFRELGLT
jgi:hypothetical protein